MNKRIEEKQIIFESLKEALLLLLENDSFAKISITN